MGYSAPEIDVAWKQSFSKTAYTEDKSPEEQLQLKNGDKIVFALDKIAQGYIRGMYGDKILASSDAFMQNSEELYFIEFKNQQQKNVDKKDVQAKALGNLMAVQLAFFPDKSIVELAEKAHFFVVFRDFSEKEKEYFEKLKERVGGYAQEEIICFGLRQYLERGLYRELHTIEVSKFNEIYSDSIFREA